MSAWSKSIVSYTIYNTQTKQHFQALITLFVLRPFNLFFYRFFFLLFYMYIYFYFNILFFNRYKYSVFDLNNLKKYPMGKKFTKKKMCLTKSYWIDEYRWTNSITIKSYSHMWIMLCLLCFVKNCSFWNESEWFFSCLIRFRTTV